MANFLDVSNITYCGKEIQKIFAQDMYSLDVRNAGITLMPDVKGKTKLYSGELGDILQLYSCPFSPQGAASLAESFIEPAALKANLEQCYDAFWSTFMLEGTEISLNGGVPPVFAEWFFTKFREKMKKEYEEIFWKGDTDYSGSTKEYLKAIDGIEKQLADNSGVTKVSATTFTVDNVLAQVEATIMKGLDVAQAAEVPTERYKVLMNKYDIELVKMSLGAQCCPNNDSIFSNYAKGPNGGVIIYGFELIPTEQSRNTIIFGDPRNLVLGFDVWDSHLTWKFIDMRDTTGDNAFRIISLTNIAAGIVFPEGFVFASV